MKFLYLAILLMLLASSASAQQLQQEPYWAKPRTGFEDRILSDQQINSDSQKALNGDGGAAAELGNYYLTVVGDRVKGEYWYRIAAENGDPGSERSYGNLLMQGSKEDKVRAIFWYERAANGGDSVAKETLKKIHH
jgi:TPR repeat protein